MKRHSIEAILLSSVLAISSCMPVGTLSAFAAEAGTAVEAGQAVSEEDAEELTEDPAAEADANRAAQAEAADNTTDAQDAAAEADVHDAATEDADAAADDAAEQDAEAEDAITADATEADATATTATDAAAEAGTEAEAEAATTPEAPAQEAPAQESLTQESSKETDLPVVSGEVASGRVELDESDLPEGVDEDPMAAYIEREFGIEDGDSGKYRKKEVGSKLTGVNRAFYDYIGGEIVKLAAGERTSTMFKMPTSKITSGKTSWKASELGVSDILVENPQYDPEDPSSSKWIVSEKAEEAFLDKVGLSSRAIILALITDYPYELFWFNKTYGFDGPIVPYNARYDKDLKEDVIEIDISDEKIMEIDLKVLKEYAAGNYEVKADLISSVKESAARANSIVTKYQDAADYDKLHGYLDEICSLVEYNETAMTDEANYGEPNMSGKMKVYGNPWQLVWVFDGDPSTNVVCEGYSKAFQYLCDKTAFKDDSICCTCVTGKSSEDHMWNLVTMDDGLNYVVDATNCDEGTIGYPDKLFLAGAKGTVKDGYFFRLSFNGGHQLIYDKDAKEAFADADLALADHYYGKKSIANTKIVFRDIEHVVYDGTNKTPALKVTMDGQELVEGRDYELTYGENNIGPGTDAGAVMLKGIGDYSNNYLVTFDIKKERTLAVNPAELTVRAGDWISWTMDAPEDKDGMHVVQLTGFPDDFYVKSSKTSVAKVSTEGDESGWVQAVGGGSAVITLTAGETEEYFGKEATLKVNVVKIDQNLVIKNGGDEVKKGGTVTVAPGKSLKLTVSGAGEKLTVKSADTSVAKASVSGSTITVKGLKYGQAALTVTAAGSGSHNAGSTNITIVVGESTTKVNISNLAKGFKLAWTKVDSADSYIIYRYDGKKTTKIKTITSGSTVTYTVTGADANGTKYTYAVKARRDGAISPIFKKNASYRLSRPALKSIVNGAAGKMTVRWVKNVQADGFEIQYSLKSSFSDATTVKVLKGTSCGKTLSGVKKGKTYYVRIRSYKMNGKVKNNSMWSPSKTIKVTK